MNKNGYLWLLILWVPAVQAARDPFLPAPDPCAQPFLHAHYRGWIISGIKHIALVEVTPGHWQRWELESQIAEGWQVIKLDRQQVAIGGPPGCQPKAFLLSQQGAAQNEDHENVDMPDRPGPERNRFSK